MMAPDVQEIGPEVSAAPDDGDGFDRFYADRFHAAVRLAYVLTADAAVAEDIAQDAFLRVRPRFDTLREPWPYTRAAIVNGARSHGRRGRRERARLEVVAAAPGASTGPPALELLDAVDRLPYRQKVVVVLRYYEDLSEREIASVLGCRPGTVKSLASRALSRLAQEIHR